MQMLLIFFLAIALVLPFNKRIAILKRIAFPKVFREQIRRGRLLYNKNRYN